jgi:hypothetical protein
VSLQKPPKARGTLTAQPTVAFEEILGDFKRNE